MAKKKNILIFGVFRQLHLVKPKNILPREVFLMQKQESVHQSVESFLPLAFQLRVVVLLLQLFHSLYERKMLQTDFA